MRSSDGRMDAFKFLLPSVEKVGDKLERAAIASDLAGYLGVEPGLVLDQFRRRGSRAACARTGSGRNRSGHSGAGADAGERADVERRSPGGGAAAPRRLRHGRLCHAGNLRRPAESARGRLAGHVFRSGRPAFTRPRGIYCIRLWLPMRWLTNFRPWNRRAPACANWRADFQKRRIDELARSGESGRARGQDGRSARHYRRIRAAAEGTKRRWGLSERWARRLGCCTLNVIGLVDARVRDAAQGRIGVAWQLKKNSAG